MKQNNLITIIAEIIATLSVAGGFVGVFIFMKTPIVAASVFFSGLITALLIYFTVQILKSLWRIEALLAKGNYDYGYVNKLRKESSTDTIDSINDINTRP